MKMQVLQNLVMLAKSRLWMAPNWPQIRKMIMTCNLPTWRHRQIFWRCFVSHLKSGYWSKFDVNIITGSGVMAIFFCKGLTRNTEIENTPVWALPNIWRLGRVRHTNVINEIWLYTAKYPGYSFHYFWVIKGKPTMKQGGGR